MRILMRELAGAKVLAGAPNGQKVLMKLMEQTGREPAGPEPVFLDFSGVEVATASFLRESILAFRDTVRNRRSNFYPVIANVNDLIADELAVLLAPHGDVLMLCTLDQKGRAHEAHLAGDLDPKQRVTFNLVRERGETDAAELMRVHGKDEGVKQTAWNNRLAALANLGLVVELSEGRAKRYRPLFTEVQYGN
ncbi:MAG: hypothetical protein ACRD2G_02640 [Terriglobia bacterium]